MAGSKAIVQDQDGARWLVLKDDPAWGAVVILRKTRTVIVLPRMLLTTGTAQLASSVELQMQRLGTAMQVTDEPAVVEAYKRSVILYDCLAALERVWYNRSGEVDGTHL